MNQEYTSTFDPTLTPLRVSVNPVSNMINVSYAADDQESDAFIRRIRDHSQTVSSPFSNNRSIGDSGRANIPHGEGDIVLLTHNIIFRVKPGQLERALKLTLETLAEFAPRMKEVKPGYVSLVDGIMNDFALSQKSGREPAGAA